MQKNTHLNSIQNFPIYSNGTNTSHLNTFLKQNNLTPTYFKQNNRKSNDDYTFFNLYDQNQNLITQIIFDVEMGLFSL